MSAEGPFQATHEEARREIRRAETTYCLSIPEPDRERLVEAILEYLYSIDDVLFVEMAVVGYAVAKGWLP